MPAMIHLYVDDCDAMHERASRRAGRRYGSQKYEFNGDRSAGVRDSAGNLWWIATHVEDVPEEEMAKRIEEFSTAQAS